MDKTSKADSAFGINRRRLLQYAGAAAAIGGLGLKASAAAASEGRGSQNEAGILDVVIVGAGLAGLTAARDLQAAGAESFVVLEARDRVGGRTLNHDLGSGYFSEVGGQWIGPGQTSVADLARELDVGTFPTYYEGKTVFLGGEKGRLAIDLHGSFGTDEHIAAKLSELSRDVPSGAPWTSPRAAELDRMSAGDWLAKQAIKPEDRRSWDISFALTAGITPAKMSLLHFLSMINSAGCDYETLESIKDSAQGTRIEGGSQILSIRMAEQLSDKVRLSCPVRTISDWDKSVVTLHTDQGLVRARRVIMAIHPALCNQLQFEPQLPEGRAALQRAWPAHSPARKTAMVYKKPFWREKGLNGHLHEFDGPVLWAWDNSPKDGQLGVINAFVTNAQIPSGQADARQVLAQTYARAFGEEALSPMAYYDHDWAFADSWTLTCISAIPPGFWTTHGEHLRPPCGNLIWSGTETADIWAGYMDGAVRSGHQSALQALHSLRQA